MAKLTHAQKDERIAELEAEIVQLKARLPRQKRELDPQRQVTVVCAEFKCTNRGRGSAAKAVGWKCKTHRA